LEISTFLSCGCQKSKNKFCFDLRLVETIKDEFEQQNVKKSKAVIFLLLMKRKDFFTNTSNFKLINVYSLV
jgi:hypothetical protein